MTFQLAFNLYIVGFVVNGFIILFFMFVIYQTVVDSQVLISSVFRHDLLRKKEKVDKTLHFCFTDFLKRLYIINKCSSHYLKIKS